MTPFLQLALAIAIIITAAKTVGYLSYRLGQPTVLGELIAGVILGPSLINLIHLPVFPDEHLAETIHHLGEFGVLILMFLAGLELHLTDLRKSGKIAIISGTMGVLFPIILGMATGLGFSMTLEESIFLGLILSATSVSISAQTLIELKVLRSRVGISLLGAAVFDDILVVLGLSVFIAVALAGNPGGWLSVLWIILRMLLFLVIASLLGYLLLPRLSRTVHALPISQGLIAFTLVLILAYGLAAEELGQMAAITGSFLVGLLFAQSPEKERVEQGIASVAYGFLVPIFFVDVGLRANILEIGGESFWFFLVMILVAITGKILGSGAGAMFGGMSGREALQLGIGMMSRGEVGLIVASVGITTGLIPQRIYSAIIGMVVITTLLTPPLLRLSFIGHKIQMPVEKGIAPANQEINHPSDARGEDEA